MYFRRRSGLSSYIKRLLTLIIVIEAFVLYLEFYDPGEVTVDGEKGESIRSSLPQLPSGSCIDGSGWIEEWISSGVMPECSLAHRNKVDVLYTWVNGSESWHQRQRNYWQEKSPIFKDEKENSYRIEYSKRRHRQHDELRYSVRSIFKYFRDCFSHLRIVSGDLYDEGTWMGQTPAWLDFELAPQYNVSILFHTELYGDKKSQLPIFNALALESQFFNVPSTSPDDDVMVYFNDDMFLASEHSVSDFWNPLLGVNIEFEPENWIMNEQSSLEGFQEDWGQRFGWRRRLMFAHFGKALSRNIFRDIQNDFPSEIRDISAQRFRGEGKGVSSMFLHTHYIIERHREILLESYLVHRSDTNGDGALDFEECQVLLAEIKTALERRVPRTTLHDRIVGMRSANLPLPKVTTSLWASTDGVPFALLSQPDGAGLQNFEYPYPPMFDLSNAPHDRIAPFDFIDMCIGEHLIEPCRRDGSVDAQAVFRLLSKEYPHCGDMLLTILIPSSPSGLRHLLPPTSHPKYSELTHLLHRYTYTISKTSSQFLAADNLESLKEQFFWMFGRLTHEGLAQFCVNDDIEEVDPLEIEKVDALFKGVIQGYFGGLTDDRGRSPVEKLETVEDINDAGKEFWRYMQLNGGPGYE